jgi:hypothetical protein
MELARLSFHRLPPYIVFEALESNVQLHILFYDIFLDIMLGILVGPIMNSFLQVFSLQL